MLKKKKITSGSLVSMAIASSIASTSASANPERIKFVDDYIEKNKVTNSRSFLKDAISELPLPNPYRINSNKHLKYLTEDEYIKNLSKLYPEDVYIPSITLEQFRIFSRRVGSELVDMEGSPILKSAYFLAYGALSALGEVTLNTTFRKVIGHYFLLYFANMVAGSGERVKRWWNAGKSFVIDKFRSLFSKGMDDSNYEEMLEGLRTRLKSKVIGQDEAIDSIIEKMKAHFANVVKHKKMGIPYKKGLMLYFIGPPGVGKSLIMDEIRDFLKLTSIALDMSAANTDRGNNANSLASRFLKPAIIDDGSSKKQIPTEFYTVLSYGISTLFTFDELDKMRLVDYNMQGISGKNDKGEYIGSSIDELLRTFVDSGQLAGFDVGNSIIIVTSNENIEDLKKLESSLYNRYKNCVVEFKPFNKEACKKFVVRYTRKFVGNYYKEERGVKVRWDMKSLEKYSKVLEKEQHNGRSLSIIVSQFTIKIDEFYRNNPDVKEIVLHYKEGEGVYPDKE